jgi:hypothetical protein
MGKRILAIIAGVITAFILIAIVEYLASRVYPAPPGFDYKNKEAVLELMKSMPAGAWWLIILAYVLGSFAGGFVAALISPDKKIRSGTIVGFIAMIAGIFNLFEFENPVWFAIVSTLVYIPSAYFGALMAVKTAKPA